MANTALLPPTRSQSMRPQQCFKLNANLSMLTPCHQYNVYHDHLLSLQPEADGNNNLSLRKHECLNKMSWQLILFFLSLSSSVVLGKPAAVHYRHQLSLKSPGTSLQKKNSNCLAYLKFQRWENPIFLFHNQFLNWLLCSILSQTRYLIFRNPN